MSDPESIAHIIELVAPFYESLDEWHNCRHGRRVVAMAKAINQTEKGDAFLVEAGAWLHQYHDELELLNEVLDKVSLTGDRRSQLYEIVERCRPAKISSECSLEARIVFDADALDLMGPSGIFREVLCNFVARRQSESDAINNAKSVQDLFFKRLQTPSAKSIAECSAAIAQQFWSQFERWEDSLK